MADIQARLNEVSGKIQYLKAERIRIEKESKDIMDELAKEGITDIKTLEETIKKRKEDLEATKVKFDETLNRFEIKVANLESKVM
jgi:uncharacterized protein (UPF0335 family)